MISRSECPSIVRVKSISLGQPKPLLLKAYSYSVRVSELNPYFYENRNMRGRELAATDIGRTSHVNERTEYGFNSDTRTNRPKCIHGNGLSCPSRFRFTRTEPSANSNR